MSSTDQIDPTRQTANISVLFNAFETLCFPQCITDKLRVYFLSVNVRKSCKYIHFAVRSGRALLRAKQTERNNSESNMRFMIAVTESDYCNG